MKKTNILLIIVMLLCFSFNPIKYITAVDFDPNPSEDLETHKEYTAELLDFQINTIMPYDMDDELGFDTGVNSLNLLGSVKINHKTDEGIELLNTLPIVNLVDENDNIVAFTEVEQELGTDTYYLYVSDLNVENDKEYKLSTTITDNDGNEITKYVTYSGNLLYSTDGTNIMTCKSINNLANINFILNESKFVLKGDLDCNGIVDPVDASYILDRYKYGDTTDDDLEKGDMDNNGILDPIDASMALDLYKTDFQELL